MGREFGKLTRVRHVISYSLSPFEQRAFPHYFSKGIPNVLRRTRERILRVAPPCHFRNVAKFLVSLMDSRGFQREGGTTMISDKTGVRVQTSNIVKVQTRDE
ncbi:hypothetical protein A6R68_06255 [Neotoma lepida]|uniref:Cytochrome b-c1 complex subunit 8 n=1 Tax=Neotoma lepida TaxID=56216 RepID=A0A1A6GIQ7_NEOLE|nr:hypothetical protein A6R68_06255 [Neotoma lepida]